MIWQWGRIRIATTHLVDEIILVTGGNIELPPTHIVSVHTLVSTF